MMKLWLLRPVDGDELWEPWFDKTFGFVVRAETEEQARAIATTAAGNEDYAGRLRTNAWVDSAHSSCIELTPDGESGIVIQDVHSA
jgi:hypothetical protein